MRPLKRLERWLLAYYLPKVLECGCPQKFARSGEAAKAVDCYVAMSGAGEGSVLIDALSAGTVLGKRRVGREFRDYVELPLAEIDPTSLRVWHYWGESQVNFDGIWGLVRGRLFGIPYVQIRIVMAWRVLRQALFNRRALVVEDSLEVLRLVFQAVAKAGEGVKGVDVYDVMTERWGLLWTGHPNHEQHQEAIERQLEYLVDSGDLKKDFTKYIPSGASLLRLERAGEERMRHRQNRNLQVILLFASLAAALFTAAQTGFIKLPSWGFLDWSGKPAVVECASAAQAASGAGP